MSDASRIAVVLPDLRLGGAQRVLLDLSREFAAGGHAVDLVSLTGDGELESAIPPAVRYVPLRRSATSGARLALSTFPALVRHLAATRPAAVLSSMTGTNLLTSAAHLAAGSPGRLVLREAVSLRNDPSSLTRWLMARLYPRAAALLAVSSGVARDLADVVGARARIHTVHNPVNGERIRAAAYAGAGDARPRGPYIVSIARLTAQKDQQTLLRAYAASASSRTHRLVVVGDGEDRAMLVALAQQLGVADRVDFAGALLNPYPVLAGAALHVLSSRWEGYPNVLLEALELGVPVCATDCPSGPRELLDDGRLGRLAPVGDHASLAEAIDAELRSRSASDRRRLEDYRPEAVARRYLALLLGDAADSPLAGVEDRA